jgi:hypothetical protein
MSSFIKITMFYLIWFFSELTMWWLSNSSLSIEYGFIMGYFLSLIYSYFAELNKIMYFLFALITYTIFRIVIVIVHCNCQFVYHDLPYNLSIAYISLSLMSALIYSSPIIIVVIINKIRRNKARI